MNTTRFLALLILSAPAAAAAAPHTVVFRASQGSRSYPHTVKAEAGAQTNFVGRSGGQNMIVNAVLHEKNGAFTLSYQLEVSQPDGSRTFQASADVALRPGDRLTAVECGSWKVDVSLDAGKSGGEPPAWSPAGPNYRLTTLAWNRRCRVVQTDDSQSTIVEGINSGGRRTGLIFNLILARLVGSAGMVSYSIENSLDNPPRSAQGEDNVVLGKKTSARAGYNESASGKSVTPRGGQIAFLVEGPAASAAPSAPSAASAPSAESGQSAVPLLR